MFRASSSRSAESAGSFHILQVNDSVYELHRPVGMPSVQVVFFHGFQLGDYKDAHWSAWTCEDGSCIWPQTWLVEELPGAHVYTVSCSGFVRSHEDIIDIYVLAENLVSDLLDANIGQTSNCPIVLVGHSIGGLLIKELCCQAFSKLQRSQDSYKTKLEKFLNSMKGVFYYATPHHGSPVADYFADTRSTLSRYFITLSKDTERLNNSFDTIRAVSSKWLFAGLGEHKRTKVGLFRYVMVVPEPSARIGDFNIVEGANHFSIIKPRSKTSRSFSQLKNFLANIVIEMKGENRAENFQRLPKYITGIDAQVQQVINKLQNNSTLGLVGLGGSGKTTLAMAVFNKLCLTFEYTCFVREVKELKGTVDKVKWQLWNYMYCNGKKLDKEGQAAYNNKQLLLVLDDVSNRDVKVLQDIAYVSSPESRFIVTTRDEDLLGELDNILRIATLDEASARDLFRSHAFPNQANPPPKLAVLMKRIVDKCEGLPLTLEVLGQYLKRMENVEHWEQTLLALEKAGRVSNFDERLWLKLMPSYNNLQWEEQQMFLDAATMFSIDSIDTFCTKWTLREVKAAWRTAYGTPIENLQWQTLVDRSLVYHVEDDDCIRIHEQLRSLGRRIALDTRKDCGRRVWERDEALRLLQITNETDDKEVHCLRLGMGRREMFDITSAALNKLKDVRFLDLNLPVGFDRSQDVSFPRQLALLKCAGIQYLNLSLQRLAVLDLDCGGAKFLPNSIGDLPALRLFTLRGADLRDMPDEIGRLSQLERLEVHLPRLQNLPETFGQLHKLTYLVLDQCERLLTLSESFGDLQALEHLELDCRWLQSLPASFGNLRSLKALKFQTSHLVALPESFGSLLALENLEFMLCIGLTALPESFGSLSSLKSLRFHVSNLQSLPYSFGSLYALERLQLDYCNKLQVLPDSFGLLRSLEHLEFNGSPELSALPESFGSLQALSNAAFRGCSKLAALPQSFGSLTVLSKLEISSCRELKSLPSSFGHLSALVELHIHGSFSLTALPESFGNLSALHHLTLSCGLHNLPDSFVQLSALRRLRFHRCKFQSLPKSFGQLSSLNYLEFHTCDNLHSLPKSLFLLRNLQHLKVLTVPDKEDFTADFIPLSDLMDCIAKTTIPQYMKGLLSLRTLELCFEGIGRNFVFDSRGGYEIVDADHPMQFPVYELELSTGGIFMHH